MPEINTYGDVKYYYHCRGIETDYVLYRYKAPSGKEVLVNREHNWYNSAITPHIGTQVTEIAKRSGGLKTALYVYGVGDHGGGPTRRDVERALEMMTWKIFPTIKFGTMHEFFDEAEKVREQLPIVDQEMNCIFQGCYTTQSRIKRGNRRNEAVLNDAERMSALAGNLTSFPYAKKDLTKAWQNVLFTHFHDILTGSCVQTSREHAMGLYQQASAVANTQITKAMRSIALNIDTASIPVDIDAYNTISEGAGVGFGVEHFIGVPSTERGSGKTRIFHVFNTQPFQRTETVELTVWDWVGDMKRLQMADCKGTPIDFQILDSEQQVYWDHKYFRMLAEVTVPAMGYTTIVLSEAELEAYPIFLNNYLGDRIGREWADIVLENENVKATIHRKNGRIISYIDKKNGTEMIADGIGAGFTFVETANIGMPAWTIGRHMADFPVDNCISLKEVQNGVLRHSVKAVYEVRGNEVEVTYSLDKGALAVKMDVTVDWHEHSKGKKVIPLLDYRIPVAYETKEYQYDIPMGAIKRQEYHNDVPGLQYGMALNAAADSNIMLISDCKYGYRGADNSLALSLINSACAPDPYPERGIHNITLWLGVCSSDVKKAEELANTCNHSLIYQPSNCHTGSLPMETSLFNVEAEGAVVSAVLPAEDGVLVRMYEAAGKDSQAVITFASEVADAKVVNLAGNVMENTVTVNGNQVTVDVKAYAITAVQVKMK